MPNKKFRSAAIEIAANAGRGRRLMKKVTQLESYEHIARGAGRRWRDVVDFTKEVVAAYKGTASSDNSPIKRIIRAIDEGYHEKDRETIETDFNVDSNATSEEEVKNETV
ncbi:hypothetical protein DRJ17_05040 [Candidatus Woesearchaeota archaeon]|nr:MAG: hypothetical protein DRJ17_05040 [Candidatus Woesearchaeota archaeon]